MVKSFLVAVLTVLALSPHAAYAGSHPPTEHHQRNAAMDEATFWRLIEDTKQQSEGDPERQLALLQESLVHLPAPEIEAFEAILTRQREKAYVWSLWGAAYLLNGGCSDDCFDYFQGWLISQGRDVFERALANPDTLASAEEAPDGVYENELFLYVALEAYLSKTGTEMTNLPPIHKTVKGASWEEDELEGLLPQLWKRCN